MSEWINYSRLKDPLCSWWGPRGHSFYLQNKESTNEGDTAPETFSCGVIHCPETLVPDGIMEPFSLMTMGMVGFRNSRGHVADLSNQRQGELNYYNIWWDWNGSWTSIYWREPQMKWAALQPHAGVLKRQWWGKILLVGWVSGGTPNHPFVWRKKKIWSKDIMDC